MKKYDLLSISPIDGRYFEICHGMAEHIGRYNWLIKKLLTSDSTKEEVLNYIASNKDDDNVSELEDNNEKSLIKNILSLNDKSVEDIMVPRAEIVFIKDNQNVEEI